LTDISEIYINNNTFSNLDKLFYHVSTEELSTPEIQISHLSICGARHHYLKEYFEKHIIYDRGTLELVD